MSALRKRDRNKPPEITHAATEVPDDESVTIEFAGDDPKAAPPPLLLPSPPFLFQHKRTEWDVIAGVLVPVLVKFALMSGISHTKLVKGQDGVVRLQARQSIGRHG